MDTKEHTELGNALRFENIEGNPYLRVDEQGTLYLKLQRCSEEGIPQPLELEMSAGEIIAMAGDFFTDRNWNMKLDLPSCSNFEKNLADKTAGSLGDYLINQLVKASEERALIAAYNNLASVDVSRKNINLIYKIDGSTYIPFSTLLNDYVKQLMFFLRVKDYGEMLNRNQTHFTPWSVRVYTLGHHLALGYAQMACELKRLAKDNHYQPTSQQLLDLLDTIQKEAGISPDTLGELAHRYQALAFLIELFVFHYYSDHFASGHMSMVGDLRTLLPERFGTWGSILANDLHNELNRIGVYTKKPYDPTPQPTEAPIAARGDGDFNGCMNYFNKNYCLAGMQSSIQDLTAVLGGEAIPAQKNYGGLEHLPDIDYNYRQPQPLIILGKDNKIYCRKQLNEIHTLSPSAIKSLGEAPKDHGYQEIKNKWHAFALVAKLRLLPFIYSGELLPLSARELLRIEAEERRLNPERESLPVPPCSPEVSSIQLPNWRTPARDGLAKELTHQGIWTSEPGHRVENNEFKNSLRPTLS
ncbi:MULTISPECIES: type IV secretion protein Dot [unclassified Legionella]|uniref:type IV secretion protein Dot n=1 Tax=unclassified Legionella TaxID=2622702 RepID=UPI0010557A63|nr:MULTISPECIES: type IV secretion protein Dot [unclassified Legionella]MDI9817967.1 type IV secretion protein Dot [Legionella sp. PL877]